MRKRILKGTLYFLGGFAILFVFRFIYGYTDPYMKGYEQNEYISDFFENMESVKRNYASYEYQKSDKGGFETKAGDDAAPPPSSSEQKFEKIASLKSKTDQFEEDEKTVRGSVKKFNALIQYEHNAGNPGDRELHLSIGVPPEEFDNMLSELKGIGRLKDIQVTKYDKTNEYRDLNAHKTSLEKTRTTLIELKSKEGKIDEYISLTNRILEIEEQLQQLGVQLGDFDEENEFCTIRMTLAEGKFIAISLMHRIKVALEWSFNYYCIFMLILVFASGSTYFIIKVYEKISPSIKK